MGLDLTIKSCCDTPFDYTYIMNKPIEIYFGKDGWPIVDYIQDELKHEFEDCLDTVHLDYHEFCKLVLHFKAYEFGDIDAKTFIGDERWYALGVMMGCCKDCGVDVFASW